MTKAWRKRASKPLAMLIIALAVAVALSLVVGLLWLILNHGRNQGAPADPLIPDDHCMAIDGAYSGSMTPEQAGNAAIIVGESLRRGLPARAATIALVTAWQESSLQNLDYGDRDSLGLFQQRPSQGWGTPEQIMNPWYAAGKFYNALVKVKNWQTMDIGAAAQAVQKSGYPNAYDQHVNAGRAWASALTGFTAAGVTCILNQGTGGGATELTNLLKKVWKNKLTIAQTDTGLTITATDNTTAWSVAQLSMAQLASYGIASVQVGDHLWQSSPLSVAGWQQLDDATQIISATKVVLVLT